MPAKVRVHTQLAGGSFGRRAQFGSPYMKEAAEVFKATDGERPLKHMWTREDDLRGGYLSADVRAQDEGRDRRGGKIVAWDQIIVGQSIMGKASTELDDTSVEGASDLPYGIGNLRVVSHNVAACHPATLVAFGRPHAHRLCGRDLRRRAAAYGRQGPGRWPPCSA